MSEEIRSSIAATIEEDGSLVNSLTGEKLDPAELVKTNDIYIVDAHAEKIGELATGVAIPTYRKKSWDYLKDVNDFKDVPDNDIYKHIDVCNKLYKFEPVIGTAIDLFVDFTISSLNISTDNEKLNKIIDYLKVNLNKVDLTSDSLFAYPSGINALSKEIASEWFISGNVFPYSTWYVKEIEGSKYRLPTKIINMNPLTIKLERLTGDERKLGNVKIKYNPSGYYSNDSDSTTINVKDSNYQTQSDIDAIIGTKKDLSLDCTKIYHIKRKYSGFKLWGIPYLTRSFTAIKAKRKLRYLDDATIDGLVNYIVIFKIGSADVDSPYHKVSYQRLAAFKSLVENPQASNMIVWPHDIDTITVGPDGKILNFKDRYEIVDRDILRSLGIPPVLLDGSGNQNVTWTAILALVERLESVREAVSDYLTVLIHQIVKENPDAGFEFKDLNIKWGPSNLRDEKTIKTLLLAFYDRGLLPIETTLFQGNYDPNEIIALKKKEKSSKIGNYFERPDIPFSPKSGTSTPKNYNRNVDNGRPVDNTNIKNNVSTSERVILNTFEETINNTLSSFYEELKDIRKVDDKIKDRILGMFLRFNQISDLYINMEIANNNYEFDNESLNSIKNWKIRYLDDIKENFITNLNDNLLYLRKETVANFVTAGVFSLCEKELNKFCGNILFSVGLANLITNFSREGNKFIDVIGLDELKTISIDKFFTDADFYNVSELEYNFRS